MSNKITLLIVLFAYCHAFAATSTLTFTAKCNGSGTADDGVVWTVSSDGTESSYNSTKGVCFGSSSNSVSYLILSTNDIPGTITQVKVNACGTVYNTRISIKVGSSDFLFNDITFAGLASTPAYATFTGSASGEI